MSVFELDPTAVMAAMSTAANTKTPDLSTVFLSVLDSGARSVLRKAASLRSVDRTAWDRVGGDDASWTSFTASAFSERAPGERWRVPSVYVESLLTEPAEVLVVDGLDDDNALFHLLLADPERGAAQLKARVSAALLEYDLKAADALLQLVTALPGALDPAVHSTTEVLERAYRTRSLWSWQALGTQTYVQRDEVTALLKALDDPNGPWLFQLTASGGMGKTMFVHYTLGHHLAVDPSAPDPVEGIPRAHVDFDYVPDRERIMDESPWRLLVHAASQLDQQLPGRPFTSFLIDYGQYGSIQGAGGRAAPPSVDPSLNPEDVVELFHRVLSSALEGRRVVLFFDTIEVVVHRGARFGPLVNMLSAVHDGVPGLRVVLTGRFDLRERPVREPEDAGLLALLADGEQSWLGELSPLGPESAATLLRHFDVRDAEMQAAITEQSKGLPWMIVRMARFVAKRPETTPDALKDFDLRYAVERVLSHIEQRQQWAVMYASVLRRVDAELVRAVIAPRVRRGLQGGAPALVETGRDLTDRYLRARVQPDPLLAEHDVVLDADRLWTDLVRYGTEGGWIKAAVAPDLEPIGESLIIAPDVSKPLRALVDQQQQILQAALEHWRARSDTPIGIREALWCAWQLDPKAAAQQFKADWTASPERRNPHAREICEALLSAARRMRDDAPTAYASISKIPLDVRRLAIDHVMFAALSRGETTLQERTRLTLLFDDLPPGLPAVDTVLLEGGLQLARGEHAHGLETLQKISKPDADTLPLRRQTALALWKAEAAAHLRRPAADALQAVKLADDDPMRARRDRLLVDAFTREGRLADAFELLTQICDPNAPRQALKRVRLLLALGQDAAAVDAAAPQVKRVDDDQDPDDRMARLQIMLEIKGTFGHYHWDARPEPGDLSDLGGSAARAVLADLRVDEASTIASLATGAGALDGVPAEALWADIAAARLFEEGVPREVQSLGPLVLDALVDPPNAVEHPLHLLARIEIEGEPIPPDELDPYLDVLIGAAGRRDRYVWRLLLALHLERRVSAVRTAIFEALAQIEPPSLRLRVLDGCEYLPNAREDNPGLSDLLPDPMPGVVLNGLFEPEDGLSPELTALRLGHAERVLGNRGRARIHTQALLKQELPFALRRRARRLARLLNVSVEPESQTRWSEARPPLGTHYTLAELEADVGVDSRRVLAILEKAPTKIALGLAARIQACRYHALDALGEPESVKSEAAMKASYAFGSAGRRLLADEWEARGTPAAVVSAGTENEIELVVNTRGDVTINGVAAGSVDGPGVFRDLRLGRGALSKTLTEWSYAFLDDPAGATRALGHFVERVDQDLSAPHAVILQIQSASHAALPWETGTAHDGKSLYAAHAHRGFCRVGSRRARSLGPIRANRVYVGEPDRHGHIEISRARGTDSIFEASGFEVQARWSSFEGAEDMYYALQDSDRPYVAHIEMGFRADGPDVHGYVSDTRVRGRSSDSIRPEMLAKSLGQQPALIVLESRRARGREDRALQMLLRNAFAARLCEALHGPEVAVLALGAVADHARARQLDVLIESWKEGVSLLKLAHRLRAQPAGFRYADPTDVFGAGATALFAEDPYRILSR